MTDATPPTQYAYRALKSAGLVSGAPSFASFEDWKRPEGSIRAFEYSPDGKLFAFATTTSVQINDATTAEVVQEIPVAAIEIAFSPKGSQLMTWARVVNAEPGTQPPNNLHIYDVQSGEQLVSFLNKSQNGWQPQYTEDESRACRLASNEIHIYDPAEWRKGAKDRIRVEGVSSFALSPGRNPSIAAFVAEKKGAPASVKVFSLAATALPSSSKSFYKADRIRMKWNSLGTSVLYLTQTDVDKTGKSYYGETNLYLMTAAGDFDCKVTLDKEGGIHDFDWSPNGKEFLVVYGYMPAKTVLYDHRTNIIHDFGTSSRNFVSFNPQGRLLAIAGFGNLAGQISIYDRTNLQRVAQFDAPNTSHCEWSPDGRFLLCATLSPRLRVDNGVRIHHFTGELIHVDAIEELYAASWRPALASSFPFRSALSPAPAPTASVTAIAATAKPAAKAMGAYRPPGARGTATPAIYLREEDGGAPYVPPNGTASTSNGRGGHVPGLGGTPRKRTVPGAAPTTNGSTPPPPGSGANREKGGQQRKKKRDESAAASPVPPATPVKEKEEPEALAAGLSPADKKKRALQKKLTAIEQLKERMERGDPLEQTQLRKIATEAEVRSEMAALEL